MVEGIGLILGLVMLGLVFDWRVRVESRPEWWERKKE